MVAMLVTSEKAQFHFSARAAPSSLDTSRCFSTSHFVPTRIKYDIVPIRFSRLSCTSCSFVKEDFDVVEYTRM